jgi:hypothetical protein
MLVFVGWSRSAEEIEAHKAHFAEPKNLKRWWCENGFSTER